MTDYRKIWEATHGPIPLDENERPYEIHHIDGNHSNNDIQNLQCVSIQEHYNIHYNNGDYGACVLIAKRMSLPKNFISTIQKGKKRPGIGGAPKGRIPWNKGISGYNINVTVEGKQAKIRALKNRSRKIKDDDVMKILEDYRKNVDLTISYGHVSKNGKIFSYQRAFVLEYSQKYNVTPEYIFRIIKKLVKNV